MTRYVLCKKLGEVLPKSIKSSLYHAGLLNTVQHDNTDVSIDVNKVHSSLKQSIERVKRQSAKTIKSLQAGIDLIYNKKQ